MIEKNDPASEEKYKVSICIPIYNTSKDEIYDCLDSIKTCSLKPEDFEIVVIDDGSTEYDVLEYVESLKLKEAGFNIECYKHLKNEGLLEVRRSAINVAKGHYIYNLDSDDFLEPGILGKVVEKYYNQDYDIIQMEYTELNNTDLAGSDKKDNRHHIFSFDAKVTDDSQSLLRCFAVSNSVNSWVWAKLIKASLYKSIYRTLPKMYLNYNEDWLQTFLLCKFAKSIISLPNYSVQYYCRSGMTRVKHQELREEQLVQVLSYKKVMEIINPENAKSEDLKNWIMAKHLHILLEIYSAILLGSTEENIQKFVKMFVDTFGIETVKSIDKIFKSIQEHPEWNIK